MYTGASTAENPTSLVKDNWNNNRSGTIGGTGFDPLEKVIPPKAAFEQKASFQENTNAAASTVSSGTSSIASFATIKAERQKDAVEYQRTRVHNTRKVLPYVSLRIALSKYFICIFS